MKSVSDVLHKTPWWALLLIGVAFMLGLAAFAVPYHIIDYRSDAATSQERQQIKREVDNALSDNAIDIARGVLLSMRRASSDPALREELDEALGDLVEARRELRDAGREAAQVKREAQREARRALKEASRAVARAQKEVARARQKAGADPEAVRVLEETLAAARKAQEEAIAAAGAAAAEASRVADQQVAQAAEDAAKKAQESSAAAPKEGERRSRLSIQVPGHKSPVLDIDVDGPRADIVVTPPTPPGTVPGVGPPPPLPPLPPELRSQIRENVTRDLYRVGLGAGLVLIFIPLFILLIVAKFFIDRSRAAQRMAELKRKEAEYHRMSQQVTEAKLSALQAQVEPHFLYNTLASVQALTEVDPARANEMTGHLIQYLRNALPKMRESVSTVGQEVELVRAYLNILQMRMGKRLVFDIDVPSELMDRPFPPLMLPSLVENAIKHGLEPQREGGEVRISATEAGGRLSLVVADTGRGFGDTTAGSGVGLTNIRERLAAMYGEEARLTLETREPRGVVATIEVPREGARAADFRAAASPVSGPPPQPAQPATRTRRTLNAMGSAERAWRKGLTFAFIGLVVITAIVAGLAIFGVTIGALPVHVGEETISTGPAKLLGTAGIAIAFAAVVVALAIMLAVVYGMGFLLVGLAIFIPIVIMVSAIPALSPFILGGLGVWWFIRWRRRKAEALGGAPPETPPVAGAQ